MSTKTKIVLLTCVALVFAAGGTGVALAFQPNAGPGELAAFQRAALPSDKPSPIVEELFGELGLRAGEGRLIAAGVNATGVLRKLYLEPADDGSVCYVVADDALTSNVPVSCAPTDASFFSGAAAERSFTYSVHFEGSPQAPSELEVMGLTHPDAKVALIEVAFADGTTGRAEVSGDGGFWLEGSSQPVRLRAFASDGTLIEEVAGDGY